MGEMTPRHKEAVAAYERRMFWMDVRQMAARIAVYVLVAGVLVLLFVKATS